MISTGKFITVEGTEGVGKSTNIELIKTLIQNAGVELVVTREPGGTPLAEELRNVLLVNRDENFDPLAELLVVFAARAQHLNEVIKPALAAGKWVLSDRFTDATFAYQGMGRGLPVEAILQLEQMVQQGLQPDTTFLLDIDVTVGLERARERGELDRFENEAIAFFEKVRAGYHERVAASPDRFMVIDAGQTLEAVQHDVTLAVQKLLA